MAEEETEAAAGESFVDSVLGDSELSHSPDTAAEELLSTADVTEDDGGDAPIPDGAEELDFSETSDSTEATDEIEKSEGVTEVKQEDAALKQEIEGLKKRLHDTQAAMHKATSERSALQKELSELKAKEENEDDWFSESDKSRVEELEEKIKRSEEEITRFDEQTKEIEHRNAEAQWDAAAAPVIAQHADFEKVMYDEFTPLLDPRTGNPQVRAEWDQLKDKSPLSAYKFAKRTLEVLEIQRDPEAYKAKLRRQIETEEYDPDTAIEDVPLGKAGLDMLQSADVPTDSFKSKKLSFVDAVFG